MSLKLGALPTFREHPKEYNLRPSRRETFQPKESRTAFVFSEKDVPGTKRKASKAFGDEEDSNFPLRSYLFEKNMRGFKRSEDKKAGKPFEPYVRKAVPKQTAIAGVVAREFECAPVENAEFQALQKEKAELMLKPKEEVETSFDQLKDARYLAPGTVGLYGKSVSAKVSYYKLCLILDFADVLCLGAKEERGRQGQPRSSMAQERAYRQASRLVPLLSLLGLSGDQAQAQPAGRLPARGTGRAGYVVEEWRHERQMGAQGGVQAPSRCWEL